MRVALLAILFTTSIATADPPKRPAKASQPGAIVFVLDRSGSMHGPKLEAAKTATLDALDALGPKDDIAVVVFDSESKILVASQPAANKAQIKKDVATLTAGGGTNYLPGLTAAYDILHTSAKKKRHVVLMSDGEAPSDGIVELVEKMRDEKITVSTVGVQGADRNLLTQIADVGAGRPYMVDDVKTLGKVFVTEIETALR